MKRVYHQCHFCGGEVSEQKVMVDYRQTKRSPPGAGTGTQSGVGEELEVTIQRSRALCSSDLRHSVFRREVKSGDSSHGQGIKKVQAIHAGELSVSRR